MSHVPKVCVVGTGISGLTSALRLQQDGFDVTVLESEAEIGGRMSSVECGGFIINRGAQSARPGYCSAVAELQTLLDPASCVQFAGDYFGSSSVDACVRAATRAAVNIIYGRN